MNINDFFVKNVSPDALKYFSLTYSNGLLESDEKLICTDLVCEGPVEGLVNKDGELLKYVSDSNDTNIENLILGKGVYYNNVPLIDTKLDKLNYVTQGFSISYGEELNNYKNQYASTVYKYNQKLYLNENNTYESIYPRYRNGVYAFANIDTNTVKFNDSLNTVENTQYITDLETQKFTNQKLTLSSLITELDEIKKTCQDFNHKIRNKYCDQISIQIRVDRLFTMGNSPGPYDATLAIEISEDNTANRFFLIFSVYGISKSDFTIDLPINLNLNSVTANNYYVKVYAISPKINPNVGNLFREISVSAIIERIRNKGSFGYPFSSIVKSAVSSRHFNKDPERTFDLKLLKIKVPKNYDPECKEYTGNWNGVFDSFLRWTDNPAWIFYDICTNARYGVGNGKIYEKDLNKWELYKISKYCDELVKVSTPNKYFPDSFKISVQSPNSLIVPVSGGDGKARSLDDIKKQYPPIFDLIDSNYANNNGGLQNSLIYLYNLNNGINSLDTVYKKLIWSIEAFDLDAQGNEVAVTDGLPSYYKINLINDFGPRKFFENDTTGLFQSFCQTQVAAIDTRASLNDRIQRSKKNTEGNAKNFILLSIANAKKANLSTYDSLINSSIFPNDVIETIKDRGDFGLVGNCLPRVLNYRDPFEHRFTCNLLIDNEVECLKLLNDIASIFRGITYYKSNYITSTIDVDKPISYIFNNSNVKNGYFSYSSASLDGNYTVAKVLYKDKYENYIEQVEIIEDALLIKNYGIVTKEILGFGITSRDQARRIGQWMLLTNRFENQSISFSTDLQGVILKPSDIIQIQDQNKNDSIIQGRVVSVDFDNKYIVVDRQINLAMVGKKIKFLFDQLGETIDSLNAKSEVSDSDIDNLQPSKIIELQIDRIENNKNRVYFDTSYNYIDFYKLIATTPFIIIDTDYNNSQNLYKIISISEVDNNEYSLFCIKHDPAKYEALTTSILNKAIDFSQNTINFSNSDLISEIDVSNINFYSVTMYDLNSLFTLNLDYSFNELRQSLIMDLSKTKDYGVMYLNLINLFNKINDFSKDSNNPLKNYYLNIQNVLNNKGGILCKIMLRNQSVKFIVRNSDISNKIIFLGKFGVSDVTLSASADIKFYLFDSEYKIINV